MYKKTSRQSSIDALSTFWAHKNGKEQNIQSFISFLLWVKRHLLPLVCSLWWDFVYPVFNSSLTVGVYPEESATALQQLIPSPPQPAPIPSLLTHSPPRRPIHVFMRICAFKSVLFFRSSAVTNLSLSCICSILPTCTVHYIFSNLFIFLSCRECPVACLSYSHMAYFLLVVNV